MVIVKKRVSAFTGSDLRVVLRSGVVLSALRKAADKVHQITVLADCCADRDEEVHTVLTTKILPRQAEVMEAATWTVTSD
jgi:nicotinamidase-related amidase